MSYMCRFLGSHTPVPKPKRIHLEKWECNNNGPSMILGGYWAEVKENCRIENTIEEGMMMMVCAVFCHVERGIGRKKIQWAVQCTNVKIQSTNSTR
jgi:hypothetical protein